MIYKKKSPLKKERAQRKKILAVVPATALIIGAIEDNGNNQ